MQDDIHALLNSSSHLRLRSATSRLSRIKLRAYLKTSRGVTRHTRSRLRAMSSSSDGLAAHDPFVKSAVDMLVADMPYKGGSNFCSDT